jgi:acyl-coenzyme A thioesterase PaaI-like protein
VSEASDWVGAVISAASQTDGGEDQVERAVRALRAIGDELVLAGRRASQIGPVANALEALIAETRAAAGSSQASTEFDHLPTAVDRNPNVGRHNYVAPPIRFLPVTEPGVLRARVRYRSCHEGPPGCAHGGQIAAFFDELLLSCQTLDGVGGVTAQLTVRYIRAVPLYTDLVGEARIDRQEGRKRFIRGTLSGPARLVLAEAEALAIPLPAPQTPAKSG